MTEVGLISLFVSPLNRLRIPYLVTGGVASVVYGEPRFTRDIDMVVQLRPGDAARFVGAWAPAEFYVPPVETVAEESRRPAHGHFNLMHHDSAMRADIYLPGEDPLNAWALEHPVTRVVDGEPVTMAPIEAVILNKLRYYQAGGSDRHLRDIESMIEISGDQIDHVLLERWALRIGVAGEWDEVRGRHHG